MGATLEAIASDHGAPTRCPGCGARQERAAVLLRGGDRLTGADGDFAVVACDALRARLHAAPPGPRGLRDLLPAELQRLCAARLGAGRTRTPGTSWTACGSRRSPIRPLPRIWRRPPGRLLDVGCGAGHLAGVFLRHGWDVAGSSPRRRPPSTPAPSGSTPITGTLADAPWPPGTFDAIVFNHSLEHIEDPAGALDRRRPPPAPRRPPRDRGAQLRQLASPCLRLGLVPARPARATCSTSIATRCRRWCAAPACVPCRSARPRCGPARRQPPVPDLRQTALRGPRLPDPRLGAGRRCSP